MIATTRFLMRVLALSLPALTSSLLAQNNPVPGADKTASAPPFAVPANGSGNFEKASVQGAEYGSSWSPWTFSPLTFAQPVGGGRTVVAGSGIAKNGAALLADSEPAPLGERVAFLRGHGIARYLHTFQPGTWRLRFRAAQRVQSGVADAQRVRVRIGGVSVFDEVLPDGTFAEYVTEPVTVTMTTAMQITFDGRVASGEEIALIDDVRMQQLLSWSEDSTWGGSPLLSGERVRIAPDTVVLMDGHCAAKSVEVNGELIAADQDGSLTADWVLVRGLGSRLEIGTEQEPFAHQFTISLTGQQGEQILQGGTRFVMAMNHGIIDVHGLERRSWTRLTNVTGTTIQLEHPVDWDMDDVLVVAPSRWMPRDISQLPAIQSEVVVVDQQNSPTELVLKTGLANLHTHAAPVTYSTPTGCDSWQLDLRTEVGLLTRNVRIEGDASSSATRFGAHVMIMRAAPGMPAGFARISNVQMRRMGQLQELGRYPMHWHMQGDDGAGQYIRSCSIRESYNRAITIHGSNHVLVQDNFCYDHLGHGIFLEDGVEQHNKIHGNLVMLTRKPAPGEAMLPHDNNMDEPQNRSPASFWISHPNNEFVGNVACESVGTGYWFALHQVPTGASSDPSWGFSTIQARTAPLGKFDDNVCHSVRTGIDLNDSVDPNGTPGDPEDDTVKKNVAWSPPGGATINRFRVYGCATALYSGTGNDLITFDDCVLADNEWHVQFASGFTAQNSLLVENSGSGIFTPSHPSFSGVAYLVYDGPGRLAHSHLVGFDGSFSNKATVVSSVFGAAQRHTNHELEGLTFEGQTLGRLEFLDFASAVPDPDPSVPNQADSRHWGIAVRDIGGSLGQFPDGAGGVLDDLTLVTNHPMMHLVGSDGVTTPDRTHPSWIRAWMSPYRWGHLMIRHDLIGGGKLAPANQPDMVFTRWDFDGWPGATFFYGFQVDAHRQLPVIARRAADIGAEECYYTVEWAPPASTDTVRVSMGELEAGDVTSLHLLNTNGWSGETVSVNGVALVAEDNPQAMIGLPATAYARTHGQSLWLRIVQTGAEDEVVITW